MRNELGINPVLWYSLVGVREGLQSAVTRPGSRPPGRTTVWTVSGRTWYGDDSPHPTPLEPAEGQARLVKTVNIQGGSAKATLDKTVGWVPSRGRQGLQLLLPYRQGIWRPDRYRLGHRPVIPRTGPEAVLVWLNVQSGHGKPRTPKASHAHVIRVG